MRLPRWFVCTADASGCVPGQHRAGRPGGREGPGTGAKGGEDTWSRAGRSRDRALQVGGSFKQGEGRETTHKQADTQAGRGEMSEHREVGFLKTELLPCEENKEKLF